MTTNTTPTSETTTAPSLQITTGAGFLTATLQGAKRIVLQFFRTPQLLMLGTIQGALFLFMFRYIFGGAISPASGIDYVDFLVPGFLVTQILFIGMSAATGVAEDAATGVHDGLRSLPIPRASVVLGDPLPTPPSPYGGSSSPAPSGSSWGSASKPTSQRQRSRWWC